MFFFVGNFIMQISHLKFKTKLQPIPLKQLSCSKNILKILQFTLTLKLDILNLFSIWNKFSDPLQVQSGDCRLQLPNLYNHLMKTNPFVIVAYSCVHSSLTNKRWKFFTILHENEVTILTTQIFGLPHKEHFPSTESLSFFFTFLEVK